MGNSWGNTHISRLLLIITLRFSCGERNIWKNIKNFQTITTRIIWKLSLWTGPIVINSHIFAGIYFILLRERPRPNLKVFNTKLAFHLKGRKSSHQVRQISALFCNLVALIFSKRCVNCFRVTMEVWKEKEKQFWKIAVFWLLVLCN